MAYETHILFDQAKQAIEKHKLFFIDDIIAFLPCGKTTFYEHFPNESNDYKKLFELLQKNRTEIKTSLRSKWYKSNAPALQMALYKLIATPEEHKALQMNYTDHTSGGERIIPKIKWEDADSGEL
jgi:hypothetical protein